MHSRRRTRLLQETSTPKLWWGLALLGFSSVYREGFEVVLFLQTYRLRLGTAPVTTTSAEVITPMTSPR